MTIGKAENTAAKSARVPGAESPRIAIRELLSNDDCRAAVKLQREIWGFEIGDIVPASLFHVVSFVGGLGAGAFDADGEMLGFIFGVSGVRDGVRAHWSHMLGVREGARNSGIGRMLKEFQRTTMERIGIERVYWTFDPLQAKNAYFNLHRLGAQIDEYVPDMYGDTGSPLHLGLPTDRLIVHVLTSGRDDVRPIDSNDPLPILTPFPRGGDVLYDSKDKTRPTALIETPADILEVVRRSPSEASTWRHAVRDHFQLLLGRDYVVNGVRRDSTNGRTFYIATPTTRR